MSLFITNTATSETTVSEIYLSICMGAHTHRQGKPVEGSTCPPPRKAGKLRGSRLGLPFGPSLGVQMLQSFQLQGALPLNRRPGALSLDPAGGFAFRWQLYALAMSHNPEPPCKNFYGRPRLPVSPSVARRIEF